MINEDKTTNMQKHYHALELDKILERASAMTACDDAKEIMLNITPNKHLDKVNILLKETSDAHSLSGRFGSPSFGGLVNVTESLQRAKTGSSLSAAELLRVARVLRVIRTLKEWRKKSASVASVLDIRFDTMIPSKYLEDKINSSIISEDEIADNASPELAAIRRKIKLMSSKAREQLDKMIRSSVVQKYLQDNIVTMRGGRFVIPVKAECRGNVPGLVHDTSGSGQTVFIEPMAVVEANNEIKVLESKEQDEIARILYLLTAETAENANQIIRSYDAAVELNVIFTKAELAYKMKASLPVMNNDGIIDLKKARHPLIDPEKVVAADVSLGADFDTLIITGPNTGGKTVSLKLIGLLTLMAMCGFMIPAADNSKLSVFDNVFADIGDEQSIEQSLSTFSAHITNTIDILQKCTNRSLVLLDELGAGTDPVEGAALAIAILQNLREKGAKIACTTHYAELKAFALQTSGVENGSCEFDVATLRPTYKLLIGVPGRSNAFAISLRLGMDKEIVQNAEQLVSSENREFENVVSSLEKKQQALEQKQKEIENIRRKAVKAQRKAEEELAKVRREAQNEIEQARQQAQQLMSKTRAEALALIEEIEATKKKADADAEDKAKLRSKIKSLEQTADPIAKKTNDGYVLPRQLKVGDEVLIFDIDKNATVMQLPDSSGKVLVQAGIIQTRVPLSNLRLLNTQKKQKNYTVSSKRTVNRSNLDVKAVTEVDLRGMTALEAIMELESAIDSAILMNMNQITIIHGKGTGVLRNEVHQYLKTCKHIKSFRLGVYGEGEAGVTIAEFK
ncbi:MAG: endonuclease MutS2 [Clostridia bacterium]|nr:endonuclease MutS2 [Clostridia bacterium]